MRAQNVLWHMNRLLGRKVAVFSAPMAPYHDISVREKNAQETVINNQHYELNRRWAESAGSRRSAMSLGVRKGSSRNFWEWLAFQQVKAHERECAAPCSIKVKVSLLRTLLGPRLQGSEGFDLAISLRKSGNLFQGKGCWGSWGVKLGTMFSVSLSNLGGSVG